MKGQGLGTCGHNCGIDKILAKDYLGSMSHVREPLTNLQGRRFVGLFLFVAVFFLPLHFHAALAVPHVVKECSCLHGSRTDAGIAPLPALALPVVDHWPLEFIAHSEFAFHAISSKASRAPPRFISI